MPKTSLCQLSMVDTDFEGDVAIASMLDVGGLGVTEAKLMEGNPDAHRSSLQSADLSATICATEILTILPLEEGSRFAGPRDMDARLAGIVGGIERLAPLQPDTVFFVSGPAGDLSQTRARDVVIDALRIAADAARAAGTRVALEPMREEVRADWTLVTSLREALSLLEDVGRDEVGILFDTWHLWDSPEVHELLPSAVERVFGVQIADYREPTRGPRDRVAAGDGVAGIPRLLSELRQAGYTGWYDMEVFSDDGRFGFAYPDSLWALGPEEFARRQIAGFLRCWEASA